MIRRTVSIDKPYSDTIPTALSLEDDEEHTATASTAIPINSNLHHHHYPVSSPRKHRKGSFASLSPRFKEIGEQDEYIYDPEEVERHKHFVAEQNHDSFKQSGNSSSCSSSSSNQNNSYNSHLDHKATSQRQQQGNEEDHDNKKNKHTTMLGAMCQYMNSTRMMVLLVLCLQNSLFTVLRRYSQGVLEETYSKVRILLLLLVVALRFRVER
jgi:hypothetical protein